MPDPIQVITTTDSRDEAGRIARELVERRLAACVHIAGPVTSTYRWQGVVETAEEYLCIAKTLDVLFDPVREAIEDVHSYDTPEILAVPVCAISDRYREWLESSVAEA